MAHEYHVDLDLMYSEGRVVALLELIDELPYACRLNEAILNDPERAEEIANMPKPSEPWAPKISEYDLPAVMTRELLAKMDSLHAAIVASAGGKPKQGKPFPTPRTELERAQEKADKEYGLKIIGMFGFSEEDI